MVNKTSRVEFQMKPAEVLRKVIPDQSRLGHAKAKLQAYLELKGAINRNSSLLRSQGLSVERLTDELTADNNVDPLKLLALLVDDNMIDYQTPSNDGKKWKDLRVDIYDEATQLIKGLGKNDIMLLCRNMAQTQKTQLELSLADQSNPNLIRAKTVLGLTTPISMDHTLVNT